MAGRVTKAESTLRTQEVYGYLSHGYSRVPDHSNVRMSGASPIAQIDNYIAKARQLLEEDCNIARPAYLAEASAKTSQL